jgi:hypothetical protein
MERSYPLATIGVEIVTEANGNGEDDAAAATTATAPAPPYEYSHVNVGNTPSMETVSHIIPGDELPPDVTSDAVAQIIDNEASNMDSLHEDEFKRASRHVEIMNNDEDAPLPINQVAASYPTFDVLKETDVEAAPLPIQMQQFELSNDTAKKIGTNIKRHLEEDDTKVAANNDTISVPATTSSEPSFIQQPIFQSPYDMGLYHDNQSLSETDNIPTEEVRDQVVVEPTPSSIVLSLPDDDYVTDDDKDEHSSPPYTVLEATVVDDVIYDATPFQEEEKSTPGYLTIRLPRYFLVGLLVMVFAIVAAVVTVVIIIQNKAKQKNADIKPLVWKRKGQTILSDSGGYGASTALSANGNVLAVGFAPASTYSANVNESTGFPLVSSTPAYVQVYRISNGSKWEPLGQKIEVITVEENYDFPNVRLSRDGKIVAVAIQSSSLDDSNGTRIYDFHGVVTVYSFVEGDDTTSSRWQPIGPNITGTAVESIDYSLSLSGDGKTLAFTSVIDTYYSSCRVKIYQIEDTGSNNWSRRGGDLLSSCSYGGRGQKVSLSIDGSTVAIANPYYPAGAVVYDFDSNNSIWVKRGCDIVGDSNDDEFGAALSLSANGNTLAVAGNGNVNRPGYVKVYHFDENNNTCRQRGGDINSTILGQGYGVALGISEDGIILAVGDYSALGGNKAGSGEVKVYRFDDAASSWMAFGLPMFGNEVDGYFGSELSLSANGTTIAIVSDQTPDVKVFSIE